MRDEYHGFHEALGGYLVGEADDRAVIDATTVRGRGVSPVG
jgi:hypothetical protein